MAPAAGGILQSVIFSRILYERAEGSLHIAQLLCHKLCTKNEILASVENTYPIDTSIEVIVEDVIADLSRVFKKPAETFARGSKIRPEGRAPYLHILKWLSQTEDGALDIRGALNSNPELKGSVGQVLDKGFLSTLLNDAEKSEILDQVLYFDESSSVIGIEDPKFLFYLKNMVWRVFTRQCGYTSSYFRGKYDFAISFAGANRDIASLLAKKLQDRDVTVYYDFNEQHDIIGRDIEDHLGPIYRSESNYIIAILSPQYPQRIWTKFESDQFKNRFGDGAVLPIHCSSVINGYFGVERDVGGFWIDMETDLEPQLDVIVETLSKRLISDRQSSDYELGVTR